MVSRLKISYWTSFLLVVLGNAALAEPRSGAVPVAMRMPSKWSITAYGGFEIPKNQSYNFGQIDGFTGLGLGFGLEYRFVRDAALTLDLLYTAKGHILTTETTRIRYNLNFLQLPLQLKVKLFGPFAFHFGTYLTGQMMSATSEVDGQKSDVKSEWSNDFGVTAGLWTGFKATNRLSIGLDTRVDIGLSNILRRDDPRQTVYTRALMTLATLSWDF